MKSDLITEMQFGEGAFRTVAKLGTHSGRSIVGVVAELPDSVGDAWEIWECEVIIIPIRKMKSKNYMGARADQILTSGFKEKDCEKPYFVKKD